MWHPSDIAANRILQLHRAGPIRVAVDGRSAAGKTTFADALAENLRSKGRLVYRAGIDDFHPPGHARRSACGGYTVEGYYSEGYDYAAFRDLLLAPLGPNGNRYCRLALHDSFTDRPIDQPFVRIPEDAIVIVDGCFLLRPEFRDAWDFVVWLDVTFETMVERAVKRDIAWMPSESSIRARYRERWIPLHTLYEQSNARQCADIIVDNENFEATRCATREKLANEDFEIESPT